MIDSERKEMNEIFSEWQCYEKFNTCLYKAFLTNNVML